MRKIIFIIAALMAMGSATVYGESGAHTADINIEGSRSFRGEEITAENPRTVTVMSSEPLKYDGAVFDAYIEVDGDGYRLVRREARQ